MIGPTTKLAIFHNLPEGGGLRMLKSIIHRYSKLYNISLFVISDLKPRQIDGVDLNHTQVRPWRGFVGRNLWIYFVLPRIHASIAKTINNNFDTVFVNHDYFTKSPYLLRYLKKKSIYLCQEPPREFYEPTKVHAPSLKDRLANTLRYPIKVIDEVSVKRADIVICNSKYSQCEITRIYGRKCEVVYPGVDAQYFKPCINKEDSILCVGGINTVKDQLFLVEALKPILNIYKLVLVGQGKREYIDQVREASGNSRNLIIIPHVTDRKLKILYCRSLVTCISAHNEPFGLSSIESQSCGTPVVSVYEGGPRETIINGRTGYFSRRDVREYRDKILLAIKNHNKLGKSARNNIVKQWSWSTTLKKLDALI